MDIPDEEEISLEEDEDRQESMLLDARIQSENNTARLYLDRFEAITSRAMNGDPGTEEIIV